MNLLITGASGLIGKALLPQLLSTFETKIKIFITVRKKTENAKLITEIDVLEENWISNLKEYKIDCVIHLASHLSSKDDSDDLDLLIDSNIRFGSKILTATPDIKYFINTGSFSEYHHGGSVLKPTYFYSATKIAFRSILDYYKAKNSFRVINVVPYTIYSENDQQRKVIDLLIDSLDRDEPISFSPGNQKLDFIHVDDVCSFYILLIENILSSGKINYDEEYHLGTGIGTSLKELAELIEELTGKNLNLNWGAMPYRKMDTMHSVAPIAKNMINFNWAPKILLRDGVKRILNKRNNGL